jgi:hypothetical protein
MELPCHVIEHDGEQRIQLLADLLLVTGTEGLIGHTQDAGPGKMVSALAGTRKPERQVTA